MVGLVSPSGLMTFGGVFGPITEFDRLLPALAGIVMCRTVYKLTDAVSPFFFKGYDKLSYVQKLEWNNRGFSTFHALFVTIASLCLFLLSDLFYENSHVEPVIRRRSTVSDTVLAISIGYFLSDLVIILWNFPVLGGMEYVLHHGLSMLSIFLSLISGQGHVYILMVLFTESTTPFVNLRWHLDIAGQKNTKLYILNGVAMFLGWLVARIFLFLFIFYHMFTHFDQVKTVFPLGFYTLIAAPPVLALMNLFWFWKIARGLIKTLSKGRHSE